MYFLNAVRIVHTYIMIITTSICYIMLYYVRTIYSTALIILHVCNISKLYVVCVVNDKHSNVKKKNINNK